MMNTVLAFTDITLFYQKQASLVTKMYFPEFGEFQIWPKELALASKI
jgi:hypothetical protein